MESAPGRTAPITVYSRPGCPFCFLLRRGLRRRGLTFIKINIWDDPAAAATVRAVADGNETVPTVHVAGEWLVNPRAEQVARLARA
ncbi:MAG TPA: glutaredoxin domain-containing protein [Micromonospora sp.]|nr:glutaredoxin domain-containing protein [Micromonospora sp.]